ncbi:hypothetical protein NAEGRDRAFT_59797 [Naegleria gruberi]|uniref:Uncharacterized protein n=1 Tax=Naegleria gruberi TaxID=5762 RepID=D2W0Y2_NAEGR|nr:uncharacterized protein NAEGRDRAFT_59797 [Naegleria gruberi]EFC37259.1 hypothetical protein NAEGRDRAFT_59797 [Naegleria gruberi]|eukprot:XP_002670003.1 hypothetical protein NAEGRDRAFT_59797 [Naegleria gruberi strain NEG-M]
MKDMAVSSSVTNKQEQQLHSSTPSTTCHQGIRRYIVPTPTGNHPQQKALTNHKKHHRKHHHRHHRNNNEATKAPSILDNQQESRMVLPDIHHRRRIVPYLNIYNIKEEEDIVQQQQQVLPPNVQPPLTDRAIYERMEEKLKKKKRMVAQSVDYTSLRKHYASMEAPSIRSDPPVHEEFMMESVPLVVNNSDAIHKHLYHAQRKERKLEKKKLLKPTPPVEVEENEEENEPMVINRMFVRGIFGVH